MAENKRVVARRLAMSINPSAHVNHKLKVLKGLRRPDEKGEKFGAEVYIKGGEIEVSRFEAADLLVMFPNYFGAVDDLSLKLKAAIVGGGS